MNSSSAEKKSSQHPDLSDIKVDSEILHDHLQGFCTLAVQVSATAVSLVNIMENDTLHTVAYGGDREWAGIHSIPGKNSVCQHTIMDGTCLEIKDLSLDERSKDTFYTKEVSKMKYYFGIPLKTDDNRMIGTLCILDYQEKELGPETIEILKTIADEIVKQLKTIKQLQDLHFQLNDLIKIQKKVSHDIRGPLSGIIGLSELIKEQGDDNDMDEILEMMDMIRDGGQSLLELADKISGASETPLSN